MLTFFDQTSPALLAGVRSGDPSAWRQFTEVIRPRLLCFLRRLRIADAGEDESDVASDVLLSTFKRRRRLKIDQPVWPFIRRCAWNNVCSLLRRRYRRVRTEQLRNSDIYNDDGAEREKRDNQISLRQAIDKLAPAEQSIVFAFIRFSTIAEAAKHLGLSPSGFRNRRDRVIAKLRRFLDGGM